MKYQLYLSSSSQSRQMLLNQAKIPFVCIGQSADESKCDWNLSLPEVVSNIAQYKMAHALMPVGIEGEICFVLTADTLTMDIHGKIHGKPKNKEDAFNKLRSIRDGRVITGTAFCLEQRQYVQGEWVTRERIVQYVQSEYVFIVPDSCLDSYIENAIAGSGAIGIEEYGSQFVKEINGSYTAIIGMPLFELREALVKLGFCSTG